MEYIIERTSFALREFGLGFVERFEVAGQRLLRRRGQHDPAGFGTDLDLIAVMGGNFLPDFVGDDHRRSEERRVGKECRL